MTAHTTAQKTHKTSTQNLHEKFPLLIRIAAITWVSIFTTFSYGPAAGSFSLGTLVLLLLAEIRYRNKKYAHRGTKNAANSTRATEPKPAIPAWLTYTIPTICAVIGIVGIIHTTTAINDRYPKAFEQAENRTGQYLITVTGYCSVNIIDERYRCPGEFRALAETNQPANEIQPKQAGISLPSHIQFPDHNKTPTIGRSYLVNARLSPPDKTQLRTHFLTVTAVQKEYTETAFDGWLNQLRKSLTTNSATMPEVGGSLIPGMAIGETVLVSGTLDDAMKKTSLSHLTAVSGSNFSMVVLTIIVLLKRLRIPQHIRLAAGLVVLVTFFLLVTDEPSVLRASTMMILSLFVHTIGRPTGGPHLLGLSVTLLLLFDPWLAIQYGFGLSVAATAGLIYAVEPLTKLLTKRLPPTIAELLAIPIAAQLYCQPILIMLEPAIPTYGVIANLLSAPLAPIATGFGVLASLAYVTIPPLGHLCTLIAWIPSEIIGQLALFFANAPGSSLPWIPNIVGAALYIVAVCGIILGYRNQTRKHQHSLKEKALTAASIVALAGIAVGFIIFNRPIIPKNWDIAVCDVGQGDAVFIQSGTETALIDAGPSPKALKACIDTLEIHHITLFVISHFDADHIYGAGAFQTGKPVVEHVLYNSDEEADIQLLQRLIPDTQHHIVWQGDTGQLGQQAWEILWPHPALGKTNPNDDSVIINFTGSANYLSLGDLSAKAQQQLYALTTIADTAIVKVAHHGSADQLTALYEALAADIALIPVGKNSYGHPSENIVNILHETETAIYRSDESGLILVSIDTPMTENDDVIHTREHSVYVWTEK